MVVSEETAKISVVLGGQMLRELDAPQLRVILRDVLSGERKELPDASEIKRGLEIAESGDDGANNKTNEGGQATAS